MHRLIISMLGPIEHCEVEFPGFSVYTGFQASGKSTIAKSVFYFRTIKDDICKLAEEIALDERENEQRQHNNSFSKQLFSLLREKFLRIFGSSWAMHENMWLEYHYTDECWIKVQLNKDRLYPAPNYVWFDMSDTLKAFLDSDVMKLTADPLGISKLQRQRLRTETERMFDDPYEALYIPAGRSMLTVLSEHISYIYTTMRDSQKRNIDYCTRAYIERILGMKPEFNNGPEGLLEFYDPRRSVHNDAIELALDLIRKILRGHYVYSSGEERIEIDEKHYVKLNFASSGQQESVWILNLLFYCLVRCQPVFLIIEEPESHLFPESQKYISELIALVSNYGHSILITTHSPYVLGTLNNLLYAGQQREDLYSATNRIVSRHLWLTYHTFDARFVANGTAQDCLDSEVHMIENERIDEISNVINHDFESMLEIQQTDE